MENQGHLATL